MKFAKNTIALIYILNILQSTKSSLEYSFSQACEMIKISSLPISVLLFSRNAIIEIYYSKNVHGRTDLFLVTLITFETWEHHKRSNQ